MLRERIGDRPLLVGPTGMGKGTIIREVVTRTVAKGHNAVVLAHRREIVEQLPNAYTYQSLARREPIPDVDLLVIDEAHRSVARVYQEVIKRHQPRWIVGCSATPCRLDGRPLGSLFGCIVEPATFSQLVPDYLVNPTVYDPGHPNLDGVRVSHGDYTLADLRERVAPLTGDIVATFKKLGILPAIGFAVDIQHAEDLALEFNAAGIDSIAITGDSDDRDLIRSYPGVVWSVALFTEGIDVPALATAIIARPTRSLALHRQMIGRITRPKPRAVVLDHAGNTARLGLVTDRVTWSLEGRARVEVTSVSRCSACFCCHTGGACPECGTVNPPKPRPRPKTAPGELGPSKGKAPRDEAKMRATYEALLRVAASNGRKPGWAAYIFKHRYGEWPRWEWKQMHITSQSRWGASR